MQNTKIEWTDRTWNPVTGCTKISQGCKNCYAKAIHDRFNGKDTFETVTLHDFRVIAPYSWKNPSRIFVNSMSDLFHDDVPFEFIKRVFTTIYENRRHTFQILTKRAKRMHEFFVWLNNPNLAVNFPNLWIGVSVENQDAAYERIPYLMLIPAKVRFLSCEPLLGMVDFIEVIQSRATISPTNYINWVIVGGESGPKARPINPTWIKHLLIQSEVAGIPFFFKQWGEWHPVVNYPIQNMSDLQHYCDTYKEKLPKTRQLLRLNGTHNNTALTNGIDAPVWVMGKCGKRMAGRVFEYQEYNGYPITVAV